MSHIKALNNGLVREFTSDESESKDRSITELCFEDQQHYKSSCTSVKNDSYHSENGYFQSQMNGNDCLWIADSEITFEVNGSINLLQKERSNPKPCHFYGNYQYNKQFNYAEIESFPTPENKWEKASDSNRTKLKSTTPYKQILLNSRNTPEKKVQLTASNGSYTSNLNTLDSAHHDSWKSSPSEAMHHDLMPSSGNTNLNTVMVSSANAISDSFIGKKVKNSKYIDLPVPPKKNSKYIGLPVPPKPLDKSVHQWEFSKSMNELNKLVEEPFIEFKKSSQSVEDLAINDSNTEDVSSFDRPIHDDKISKSRRFLSVIDLNIAGEESNQNSNLRKSLSPRKLRKTKSCSLLNLSNKKTTYDHIPSKVKQYIQDIKNREVRAKSTNAFALKSETKSLPMTQLGQKRPTQTSCDAEALLLDDKFLESLSYSNHTSFQEEILPEDLKKIKYEFVDRKPSLNVIALFDLLKRERKCRIDDEMTINALQQEYNTILLKYTETKIAIDDLRFSRTIQDRNKYNDISYTGMQNSNCSMMKKALSTSNIQSACSSKLPNITNFEENCLPPKTNDYSNSLQYANGNKYSQTPFSDNLKEMKKLQNNFSNISSVKDWMEKYDSLHQKIKDFVMLESKYALTPNERKIVWNFIFDKFSELSSIYRSLSKSEVLNFGLQRKYKDIDEAIEVLSRRFIGTDSLIKQKALHRDGDSGCPPSDRSTKNGQFDSMNTSLGAESSEVVDKCSFHKSNTEVTLKDSEKLSHSKYGEKILNLSSIHLNVDESGLFSPINETFGDARYQILSFDEDYDASLSSEFDDVLTEQEKNKKFIKKKSVCFHKPNKALSKYEDRFVRGCYKTSLNRSNDAEILSSTLKKSIGISQIEKNSKYFENQVQGLKCKGLPINTQEKSKSKVPTSRNGRRQSTPLKALKSQLSVQAEFSSDNSLSMHTKTHHKDDLNLDRQQKTDDMKRLQHVPKDNGDMIFQSGQSISTPRSTFTSQHIPVSGKPRFSSSTPKSDENVPFSPWIENGEVFGPCNENRNRSSRIENGEVLRNENKNRPNRIENGEVLRNENKNHSSRIENGEAFRNENKNRPNRIENEGGFCYENENCSNLVPSLFAQKPSTKGGRSKSVTSLHNCDSNSSCIYIKHFNCQGHPSSYRCCCPGNEASISNLRDLEERRRSAVFEGKCPNIINCLNKTTTLAEKLRLQTSVALNSLQTSLSASKFK